MISGIVLVNGMVMLGMNSRLTQFVKELRLMIPNSQRINRGNTVTKVSVQLPLTVDAISGHCVHSVRKLFKQLARMTSPISCSCMNIVANLVTSQHPCNSVLPHSFVADGMIISHLPFGPTAYFGISNCVLRHDLSTKVVPVSRTLCTHSALLR